METIREPAVAGMFYPGNADELHEIVQQMLQQADKEKLTPPKAIIAPHAGYIYSGPVAATAYASLEQVRDVIERVVLLGPSHRVGFPGLATSSADVFSTPLGDIPIDRDAVASLLAFKQVHALDQAHQLEHSLEVHLPFLQETLSQFRLVPLVVGDATAEEVAEVLEAVWGGSETLIVVSSDLSHYHDYDTATAMDRKTSQAIEQLRPEALQYEDACGRNPITGLLKVAQRKHLRVETVDLRNSGDTAGPRDQVVGYGAYLFHSQ